MSTTFPALPTPIPAAQWHKRKGHKHTYRFVGERDVFGLLLFKCSICFTPCVRDREWNESKGKYAKRLNTPAAPKQPKESKRSKSCGICSEPGHNRQTCPLRKDK